MKDSRISFYRLPLISPRGSDTIANREFILIRPMAIRESGTALPRFGLCGPDGLCGGNGRVVLQEQRLIRREWKHSSGRNCN